MKKILYIICVCFLFISCSSKKDLSLHEKYSIFYLDKNVKILTIVKDKDSPFSFALGFGSLLGKHLGLSTSGGYTPKIRNISALKLEKYILLYQINLNKLIINEMNIQLSNNEYYKNKLSSDHYTHKIKLSLLSYDLTSNLLSTKYQIKVKIKVSIVDIRNKLIFENTEEYHYDSSYPKFKEETIFQNKDNLEKAFKQPIEIILKNLTNKI